jgi:predicted Zn-dependent protease
MKHSRLSFAAALIAVLLLNTGCPGLGAYIPTNTESLQGSGKIYFVPFGHFPAATVKELVSFYRSKFGLHIQTLPNVRIAQAALNPERNQLIAEQAIEIMKQAYPHLKNDRQAILIGLTTLDMYIARYNWNFSFSFREQGRYAVVATGRMNLPVVKKPPSETLIMTRLRKMVTKNVGILYYHLPQSDNPRSVLYRNVGGLSELDYMGEDFQPN